jgi:ATP-dependent helicase HrpA
LLTGLLFGVAVSGEKNEYTGAGGLKLYLWPGSGVFATKPKWIVAAELVETSKRFARTVARVSPRWIEDAGSHLMKRSHVDPHWSRRAGSALCYENQTLFGLPVVVRRRVPLAPIDPVTARDLLIDHGLAEQQLRTTARFVRHNHGVIEAIAQLAARTRRRELVIDNYLVARFYQSRLPADVCDRGRLEKLDRDTTPPDWARKTWDAGDISRWLDDPPAKDDPASLYLRPDDLIENAPPIADDAFPDQLAVGKTRLPLEYHFEPGSQSDGIRVKVHPAALGQLSEERLGWLVPGLLVPKLTAMIKSLPKRIRRNLVPAAEVASRIADELTPVYGTVPFLNAVCQAMSRHAEMTVSPSDFQWEKMDEYLQFLVTVVDDSGETLDQGRSLGPLQDRFLSTAKGPAHDPDSTDEKTEPWQRTRTATFDIDALPREVVRQRGGVEVAQYPGFEDLVDGVATQLYQELTSAEASIRRGTTRLFAISERKELRSQVRHLPQLEEAKIKLSGIISPSNIETALIDLLARLAFVEKEPVIRSQQVFEARRSERASRIAIAAQELATWLVRFADARFAVRKAMETASASGRRGNLLKDLDHQLSWLFHEGFLSVTPWEWLQHYPRYLQAITYRMDRAGSAGSRDQESMSLIDDLWRRWMDQLPENQRTAACQADCLFRWMVEELRVSLFAQPLGTAVKVSPQRCEKLLQ